MKIGHKVPIDTIDVLGCCDSYQLKLIMFFMKKGLNR